jgi:CheY-like chemotaxis protein
LRAKLTEYVDEEKLGPLLASTANLFDPTLLIDMEGRFRDALSGTRRIKEIARGLGTFSRVEKGRVAPVEITGPIESALSIASNEIKYRARVIKEFDSNSFVLASDGQLSQVFLNLLINAAHSIADGNVNANHIAIKTWDRGGEVFASVEDTGCGIPQENLERIFDPFFTTKPIGIGSGLGLNIVQNIITGYGGTIHVSSKVGKGTLFVVRLPLASSHRPSSLLPAPTDSQPTGPKGRILIVDDEAQVRSALARILDWHEVIQTESGEEARALLAKDQQFDVIVCDVMMPKMSGVDLHQWLVANHPRLAHRVVFVTGGAFTSGTRAYLDQLDVQSIEKPFDATILRTLISNWVIAAQNEDATM